MNYRYLITIAVALSANLLIFAAVSAQQLLITYDDPIGDDSAFVEASGDFVQLQFTFDNVTGDYLATFVADSNTPFVGEFQLSLHLINVDLVSGNPADSELHNDSTILSLPNPQLTVSLSGTANNLVNWAVGDNVATSSCSFSNPNCFFTTTQRVSNSEIIDEFEDSIDFVSAITPVPLPPAALLLVLGLPCFFVKRASA